MLKIGSNIIGATIGVGCFGKVYSLLNDDSKCIKISTVYNSLLKKSFKEYINIIDNNINYLINNPTNPFVRVYSFDLLDYKSEKNQATFSYVMDKCFRITDDEYKMFHSLVSHEDMNKVKKLSTNVVKKRANGLHLGLDFNIEHAIMFCDKLRESNIKHLDLHPRNIMKDKFGEFKLVDLDNLKIGD